MHIEDICETLECDAKACNLRHPTLCSFFRDYRRCKFFDDCSFSHKIYANLNDPLKKEIQEIKENVNLVKGKVNEKDTQIEALENEIKDRDKLGMSCTKFWSS